MNENFLDERKVILALRDVFKGPDSYVRERRKIVQRIKQEDSVAIRALLIEHGIDTVGDKAKALLEERVLRFVLADFTSSSGR